jgi:hypothetical protein
MPALLVTTLGAACAQCALYSVLNTVHSGAICAPDLVQSVNNIYIYIYINIFMHILCT